MAHYRLPWCGCFGRCGKTSPRAYLHVVGMLWKDINQLSLPTPFYSVLAYTSDFMALSTVFHSINSPDNSLLSHSVLPVLSLPYWSFQLYIYLLKTVSLSPVLFCCDHQSISTRLVQCTESMLAWVVNEVCLYY